MTWSAMVVFDLGAILCTALDSYTLPESILSGCFSNTGASLQSLVRLSEAMPATITWSVAAVGLALLSSILISTYARCCAMTALHAISMLTGMIGVSVFQDSANVTMASMWIGMAAGSSVGYIFAALTNVCNAWPGHAISMRKYLPAGSTPDVP